MESAEVALVPMISSMSQDKTLMSQALAHSYFGVTYIVVGPHATDLIDGLSIVFYFKFR